MSFLTVAHIPPSGVLFVDMVVLCIAALLALEWFVGSVVHSSLQQHHWACKPKLVGGNFVALLATWRTCKAAACPGQ